MTTKRRKPSQPAPPTGLSVEARRLWSRIVAEFSFDNGADHALLAGLCECHDRLRGIQREIAKTGLVVTGAAGQTRANPLLQAEAEARRSILAHYRALRIAGASEF